MQCNYEETNIKYNKEKVIWNDIRYCKNNSAIDYISSCHQYIEVLMSNPILFGYISYYNLAPCPVRGGGERVVKMHFKLNPGAIVLIQIL